MNNQDLNNERVMDLLSFLPFFEEIKGKETVKWLGGEKTKEGAITMPFPEYPEKVSQFFRIAAQPWWTDYDYMAAGPRALLEDKLNTADMKQIKSVLTYCARGERFCDGFWEGLIESGSLIRVLKRIRELWSE